jgi:hypothetical protein
VLKVQKSQKIPVISLINRELAQSTVRSGLGPQPPSHRTGGNFRGGGKSPALSQAYQFGVTRWQV